MRLSEGMFLGSAIHPQGFGALAAYDKGGTVRTCALGAALVAVGAINKDGEIVGGRIRACIYQQLWPEIAGIDEVKCPVCPSFARNQDSNLAVVNMITHLNDNHRWSREKIAEWAAGLEQQIDQQKLNKEEKSNGGDTERIGSSPEPTCVYSR